jgi:hypothetical protein
MPRWFACQMQRLDGKREMRAVGFCVLPPSGNESTPCAGFAGGTLKSRVDVLVLLYRSALT